jgi:tetratricopeptide (TPR) repeat protein
MKHLFSIIFVTCILFIQPGIGAQETKETDEVPLGVQLEGLAPEARITYLRFLLRSGRVEAEIYFQLGVAFHEIAEPDSAESYYMKALETSPDLSKAYVNLAVLYDGQGKKAEALGKFEQAISANPEDLLALSHAALMHFQFNRYDRASEYISRALATDPSDPQPHFYLAIFFWESGMYREAMREWQTVVDLDPDGQLARSARENITLVQNAMRNAGDD